MSSSTEAVRVAFTPLSPNAAPSQDVIGARVLRHADGATQTATRTVRSPELRSGDWTRFGDASVLGDAATEHTLAALAETTRSTARAQGYAVGWAEGRREAASGAAEAEGARDRAVADQDARREAEHAAALRALSRAAQALTHAVGAVEQLVYDQALDLAVELTESLVGHELRTSPDPAGDVVRRVLRERPADLPAVLRVHPGLIDADARESLAGTGVRIVEDPSLGRDDAVIEIDDRVVDLRVSAALDRVREVLS